MLNENITNVARKWHILLVFICSQFRFPVLQMRYFKNLHKQISRDFKSDMWWCQLSWKCLKLHKNISNLEVVLWRCSVRGVAQSCRKTVVCKHRFFYKISITCRWSSQQRHIHDVEIFRVFMCYIFNKRLFEYKSSSRYTIRSHVNGMQWLLVPNNVLRYLFIATVLIINRYLQESAARLTVKYSKATFTQKLESKVIIFVYLSYETIMQSYSKLK